MAIYTIRLKDIVEYYYNRETVIQWLTDYNLSDFLLPAQLEIVNSSKLFDKTKLANMIIDHYYMCEIGSETMELFKHRCKIKMQELISYYANLIYTISLEYNPLTTIDYNESYQRNVGNEGTSNSTSGSNSSGLIINSDTPQGQISKQQILEGGYASSTSANENTSNITDTTSTNSNSSENYNKHTTGFNGINHTKQTLIKQYRDNIISIYNNIINDVYTLFMGIY